MDRNAALDFAQLDRGAVAERLCGEEYVPQRAPAVGVSHHAVHQQMPQMIGSAEARESRRPVQGPGAIPQSIGQLDLVEGEMDLDLDGVRADALRQVSRSRRSGSKESLLVQ